MYPPKSLHEDVTNIKLFQNLCPTADDIWLNAMALLKKKLCIKVRPYSIKLINIKSTEKWGLFHTNNEKGGNDRQLKAVFDYYELYDLIDDSVGLVK